jgi:hypothetical protein
MVICVLCTLPAADVFCAERILVGQSVHFSV